MMPRSPHCEFALRLDQVHLGTEVVVFKQASDETFQPEMVGKFVEPFEAIVWPHDIAVRIRTSMPALYNNMTYGSLGLGLRPSVALRGWCTHMTEDDLEAGRFTTYEIHPGTHCPGLVYESSWSDRFVVKIKDAHRLLGCKPNQTRALLHGIMYQDYLDAKWMLEADIEADRKYGD